MTALLVETSALPWRLGNEAFGTHGWTRRAPKNRQSFMQCPPPTSPLAPEPQALDRQDNDLMFSTAHTVLSAMQKKQPKLPTMRWRSGSHPQVVAGTIDGIQVLAFQAFEPRRPQKLNSSYNGIERLSTFTTVTASPMVSAYNVNAVPSPPSLAQIRATRSTNKLRWL